MTGRDGLAVTAAVLLTASAAAAQTPSKPQQPPAAEAIGQPFGVTVRRATVGSYLADATGMTLYVLDRGVAASRGAGGRKPYCDGVCRTRWIEFAAPAAARPIGLWKPGAGVDGPQWTYRGNPVFRFAADRQPGDRKGDQDEDLWSVIDYLPPAPAFVAPAAVRPLYVAGRYVLTDQSGRALFVADPVARCAPDCGGDPLPAGMAAHAVGGWTVARDAAAAHWLYRGRPVYVARVDPPDAVPAGARALLP